MPILKLEKNEIYMRKKLLISLGVAFIATILGLNIQRASGNPNPCTLYDDRDCNSSTSCINNMDTATCNLHGTIGCCSKVSVSNGKAKT